MANIDEIKQKIQSFSQEIEPSAISPVREAEILDDLLDNIGNLKDDVDSNANSIRSLEGAVGGHTTTLERLTAQVLGLMSEDPVLTWLGQGYAMNAATGQVSHSDSYQNRNTTELIPTENAQRVRFSVASPQYYIGYYASDHSFISSHGWLTATTIDLQADMPDNAVFFRIMINTDRCMDADVHLATTISLLAEAVPAIEEAVNGIGGSLTTLEERVGGNRSAVNALNETVYGSAGEVEWYGQGWGVNTNTGVIASGSGTTNRNVTHVIQAVGVASVTASAGRFILAFYDESENYLGSSGWKVATTYHMTSAPSGTASFCLMIDTANTTTDDIAFQFNATGLESRVERLERSVIKTEVVVDASGRGDYTTIEGALAGVDDSPTHHVVIKVMPGTYYPAPEMPGSVPYNKSNRYLTLRGVDRNACILRGDVGYYRYQDQVDCSILRLNGNVTIENLTILSLSGDYDASKAEMGWTSDTNKRAYCIHVDATRAAGTTVEIRNCILINDHFTCVGFGLKPGTTLRIEDCYCQMTVGEESGGENYGTIYGHFGGDVTDDQRLEIIRCQVVNTNGRWGVYLTPGITGASGPLRLLQNVVKTTNTAGSFSKSAGYQLDPLSYGNNVDSMNHTAS